MSLKLLSVKDGISIHIRGTIVLVASQIARKLVPSVTTDDTICSETRDSSVGMISSNCCSIPDRVKRFFSSLRSSQWLRSPTGIIPLNGHREIVHWDKVTGGVKLTTHSCPLPRLRMSGVLLPPPYVSRVCSRPN
jgi:hypothetical protein